MPVKYTRADSLEQALAALERPGARCYAGGTDLLVALHQQAPWISGIRELIDIKGLAVAIGVHDRGTRIRIGALVTAAELEHDPLVAQFTTAVAEAAGRTSAPMLRARGTVGGNLLTPHAVPDIATALLALGATAILATRAESTVEMPVESLLDFPRSVSPAGNSFPNALIVGVEIPKGADSAFEKIGTRRAFSRAAVAVALAVRAGRHRLAVSGIAERPFLAAATAAALDDGAELGDALALDLAPHESVHKADPVVISDRLAVLKELITRARHRIARGGAAAEPGWNR
jgi:CO/xanthine dehydrogenase FAD-binding subunit